MNAVEQPETWGYGRHPDDVFVVEAGADRDIRSPANFLILSGLAAGLALFMLGLCLVKFPPRDHPDRLVIWLLLSLSMQSGLAVVAGVLASKGVRWREARKAYARATGRPDLGYWKEWDRRADPDYPDER